MKDKELFQLDNHKKVTEKLIELLLQQQKNAS